MTTPGVLDLDAQRKERAVARAAKNEGMGKTLPIVFGGKQIANLDPEFPVAVLEPLTELNVDLAFIIKQVTAAAKAADRDQAIQTADLLANLIIVNPDLPAGLLAAVKEIAKRALGGQDAYEAFTAQSPSIWDIRALAMGIWNWYGVSLGELSSSSTSPGVNDGETQKPISNGTTDSTPAESGSSPETPASSGSAAS